jgi:hypothetical protein
MQPVVCGSTFAAKTHPELANLWLEGRAFLPLGDVVNLEDLRFGGEPDSNVGEDGHEERRFACDDAPHPEGALPRGGVPRPGAALELAALRP